MKQEQWEYITTNWGTQDPVVMEEIAKIKESDETDSRDKDARIEERDKKIQELTQQNVELNKTNMNLILRLTDPALPPANEPDPEPDVPSINDLDEFVKED